MIYEKELSRREIEGMKDYEIQFLVDALREARKLRDLVMAAAALSPSRTLIQEQAERCEYAFHKLDVIAMAEEEEDRLVLDLGVRQRPTGDGDPV